MKNIIHSVIFPFAAFFCLLFLTQGSKVSAQGPIPILSNGTKGAFGVAGTWVGSIVPGLNDTAVIVSGDTVSLDAIATIGGLRIMPAAKLDNNNLQLSLTNSSGTLYYIVYGEHDITGNVVYTHGTGSENFKMTGTSSSPGGLISGSGELRLNVCVGDTISGFFDIPEANIVVGYTSSFCGSSYIIMLATMTMTNGNISINNTYAIKNYGSISMVNGSIFLMMNTTTSTNVLGNYGSLLLNTGSIVYSTYLSVLNAITGIITLQGGNIDMAENASSGGVFRNKGIVTLTEGYITEPVSGVKKQVFWNDIGSILNIGGSGEPIFPGSPLGSAELHLYNINTVNYMGAGKQKIRKPIVVNSTGTPTSNRYYWHLTCSNDSAKSIDGYDLEIKGDLTLRDSALLDVSKDGGTNNYNMTITGNWYDSSKAMQPFLPRDKKVTFNGTADQIIDAASVATGETFNNLVIAKTTGIVYTNNDIKLNGNLALRNSGVLDPSKDGGTNNYNITLAGNWNDSSSATQPFIPRNKKVTFNGATAQSINTSPLTAETFYDLTNSNTFGDVSLNNDVTVNGTLHFTNGKFILGTKNLTLTTPTAITGYSASKYVVTDNTGYLKINGITSAIEFPVGISTSSYTPANINNSGIGATSTDFSVRVADKVYSYGGDVQLDEMVDRTWFITGSNPTANASLTLQWNAAEEFGTFNRAACGISQFTYPTWDLPTFSNANGAGPYTQTRSGLSTFSSFAVEGISHPLPIELLSFTGECVPSLTETGIPKIILNWSTATELNNEYFTMERSYDLLNWQLIGKLAGAGNSLRVLNYSLVDSFSNSSKEANLTKYYRLKQTDYNGDSKIFDLISCPCATNNIMQFGVYPIPASESISIDFMNFHHQNLTIQIIDIFGRIIKTEEINDFNNNIYVLDISRFNPGRYFLKVNDLTKSENVIFIKQ